jgi:acyl-CoA synthetase (AMP-forming)/AMP-acid ligase II
VTTLPSLIQGPPLAEEEGLGTLTLSGWLREVTAAHGPNEALVLHENGHRISWSFDDLWARSNEVARALIACGVGKGTRVGILMTNRPEFLAGVFGTALAGGVATTMSTFSTQPELDHLLKSSGISVLLLERRVLKKDFGDLLVALDPTITDAHPGALPSATYPFLRHIVVIGEVEGRMEEWASFLARGKAVPQALVDATAATVTPADPGVLFFSSGTTNTPKGILSAHRGVTLQLWRWPKWYKAVPGELRMWSANGFFWSGNFGMAIGGALTRGGSLVLQATFNAEEALRLMEREKVTFLNAWPHQWEQLIAAPNWSSTDLSSLIYMDHRSPIATHPTVKTIWEEPRAAYGNTETFTLSSTFDANTPDEEIGGSHGKPCPGNTFKIIDPLTAEIVPMGEQGEICVKGPTMMLGYVGIPLDETLDEDGFFRTGDGGWVDIAANGTGRLFWKGRLNDIIKTGGANVSPIEVDTCLLTCPGVKRSQTVGVPHETLGELVVGCIIPHDGETLTEEGVKAFAKTHLASFKVPRRVLFFTEDDLKTTGTDKIKTSDLRALVAKRLEAEG